MGRAQSQWRREPEKLGWSAGWTNETRKATSKNLRVLWSRSEFSLENKMLLEVLLILPMYIVFFGIFWRFRHLIKVMTDIDEIFSVEHGDEGVCEEEVDKRDFLVQVIMQGKADKLPGKTKWTEKKVQKASDKVVEKLYHGYHQADIKHKAEMTGKAVSSHVVSMYSKGVSRVFKIDSVEQLRKDIDDDPIIKESMADIGALLVGIFGKFLTPLLIGAHTANHVEGFTQGGVEEENSTINE